MEFCIINAQNKIKADAAAKSYMGFAA